MKENENLYQEITRAKQGVEAKAIQFVTNFAPYIILSLNIVFEIVLSLYKVWFSDPFIAADFWVSYFTSVTTSIFCFSFFVPYGAKMERLSMPEYCKNRDLWSAMSAQIRKDRSDEFADFCRKQSDEEREEIRRSILANNTMISYVAYCEEYRGRTRKEIAALVASGRLSKSEATAINRCNGRIRLKPVNPLLILSGVKAQSVNDAGRADSRFLTAKSILSKPLLMLVISAISSAINREYIGVSDGSFLLDMAISVFTIILASVMGYASGASNAHKESDAIKSRIMFIERFIANGETSGNV